MIYMDNAATTPVCSEALNAMKPYFDDKFANPAAVYEIAEECDRAVWKARKQIADVIGARPEEIFFTSGGTESDNWVIKSFMGKEKNHIITSPIEHHAILNSCKYAAEHGCTITYCDVDAYGTVNVESIRKAITKDTGLISIMYANNEVGTIQPVKTIGKIAREAGVLFHTDGVQAFAHIPINVKEQSIDLLSGSSHKFGGPKGCGFIYIKDGKIEDAFMHGGSQEKGLRAGTTNVPGIVGMGCATEMYTNFSRFGVNYVIRLRNYFIKAILREIPGCRLNGHPTMRLPGNVNFYFKGVRGENVVVMLDLEGICASAASACSAGGGLPSHVLMAMGQREEEAIGAVRFTLSEKNTIGEVNEVVRKLKIIIKKLREEN